VRVAPPHNRIRILHVITWLGVGGAERLVLMAATRLPSAQFESAVCCFTKRGPFGDDAERLGVKVWCLGEFPSLRHPLVLFQLYRIIREFRPDIVHTHLQAPNLYGRLMAFAARVPVVVTSEHNVYTAKARRYIFVERLLARRTNAIIAVSEEVRRFLSAQLGLNPSQIQLVENGIATEHPSPERVDALRQQLELPAGAVVLGTVASLTAKKGHAYLLQALAALSDRGIVCTLLLAGDGPERQALEARAVRLGISGQVRFLGVQPHVADVLAVMDIFVLPSITEGLPLALLEAMAATKPVIATAVGGIPEVITTGVNGMLVEREAVQPLADAIETLVTMPGLRALYGERARATVLSRFTEEQHLRTLASLYLALTERVRRA
jgi:glycosyltransferase involved in cell wall biosynthesis